MISSVQTTQSSLLQLQFIYKGRAWTKNNNRKRFRNKFSVNHKTNLMCNTKAFKKLKRNYVKALWIRNSTARKFMVHHRSKIMAFKIYSVTASFNFLRLAKFVLTSRHEPPLTWNMAIKKPSPSLSFLFCTVWSDYFYSSLETQMRNACNVSAINAIKWLVVV